MTLKKKKIQVHVYISLFMVKITFSYKSYPRKGIKISLGEFDFPDFVQHGNAYKNAYKNLN